jgi:hypothetical protein
MIIAHAQRCKTVKNLKLPILMTLALMPAIKTMDVPGPAFDQMDIDGISALVRIKPRIEDIVLLQSLRKGYSCAASEIINAGIGRSQLTVSELHKPDVAEGVMWGGLKENHPNTINALIAESVLPQEKWQKVFERLAGYIMLKDSQAWLPVLVNSHAIRYIDVNRQFKYGQRMMLTALCVAADFGLPKIVQLLLNARADINARGQNDEAVEFTPIMCAINHQLYHANDPDSDEKDRQEVVELLLACPNIDLEYKNRFEFTVLLEAIIFHRKAVVPALVAKGADINAQDRLGRSPLMLALWRDDADAALILLKRSADVNLRDDDSHTALDYANNSNDPAAIRDLIPLIEAGMREQEKTNK